jgi:hypothetical protein
VGVIKNTKCRPFADNPPFPHIYTQEKKMAKPQTITQKILAAHCGKDYVEPES